MTKHAKALSKRLRAIRGDESMRGFCKRLGLHHQAWSQYEAGKSLPSLPTIITLARKEGVNLHWLGLGEGNMYR